MSKWRKFVYFLALANGEQLPAEIVEELLNIDWILDAAIAVFFYI